jgi:hypothetical protein
MSDDSLKRKLRKNAKHAHHRELENAIEENGHHKNEPEAAAAALRREARDNTNWARVGGPFEFGLTPEGVAVDQGWAWRLERGSRSMRVWVEVAVGERRDLPLAAREAIRSRGASAVDAVLNLDNPPEVLRVDATGIHARDRTA